MFDPIPKAIHLLTDKFPNQNNNLSYFDVQSDKPILNSLKNCYFKLDFTGCFGLNVLDV